MPTRIMQAIKNAADRTGVDFSYLVNKASQESGFNPTAKASTSSATGLYQFTSQTWLQMVKTYGAQYGLSTYASQISADQNGHLSVSDPSAKQTILGLRNDPTISAEMAGELDKENASSLQDNVGGKIGGTELYLAHFLGAGGASDFISAMRSNPNRSAASIMPTAAAANPSIFYAKDGQPRSLQQIYQHFAQKFDTPLHEATIQVASNSASSKAASTFAPLANANKVSTIAALSSVISSNMSAVPHISAPYSTAVADAMPSNSGLRSTIGAGGINLSGSSTLFAAMILGQMHSIENVGTSEELSQINGQKKNDVSAMNQIA